MCSMGMAPGTLNVLPTNRVSFENKPAANIQDKVPFLNISPFGLCNSLANPITASQTAAALGVLTPGGGPLTRFEEVLHLVEAHRHLARLGGEDEGDRLEFAVGHVEHERGLAPRPQDGGMGLQREALERGDGDGELGEQLPFAGAAGTDGQRGSVLADAETCGDVDRQLDVDRRAARHRHRGRRRVGGIVGRVARFEPDRSDRVLRCVGRPVVNREARRHHLAGRGVQHR